MASILERSLACAKKAFGKNAQRRNCERKSQAPFVGKAYRYMEYYVRLGVVTNAFPFGYNRKALQFSVNKRSLKFCIWAVIMFGVVFTELGVIFAELVRSKADPLVTRGEWCSTCFLFLSWLFLAGVDLNFLVHPYKLVNHMNQLLRMRQWFTESKLPPTSDHKAIRAQMIFCFCSWIFQSLLIFAERRKGQFLYSYLPESYQENTVAAALWFFYAFFRIATNFLAGLFQYFTVMLHAQACNQVMAYRREQGGRLSMKERLKYYRMLQILSSRFSEAYALIFIPSVTLFVVDNIILGAYGIIKLQDGMELDKYLNFPIMTSVMMLALLTFFPRCASVYEDTKDERINSMTLALAALRHCHDREELTQSQSTGMRESQSDEEIGTARVSVPSSRKRLERRDGTKSLNMTRTMIKSCPIIGIPFGSLYLIKQSTMLSLFDFTAGNTVSTLLTYP